MGPQPIPEDVYDTAIILSGARRSRYTKLEKSRIIIIIISMVLSYGLPFLHLGSYVIAYPKNFRFSSILTSGQNKRILCSLSCNKIYRIALSNFYPVNIRH